ncbi:isochorismatase family cysteine hydrolase [[Clostridium] symbiosum]|uniref:cysteine hydrolase family protein n=1 Tax=Clostridium symbiosum TaxID=1512 RepID=UPI001D065391|nr:isochorismatase family cysteine hydrolase [[Clostridium] symbiosum]MCB6608606.1 cysteine hydrolase [[Clostridium] symbiosum]MCB6931702.1 cysteine hydrolase [[Clostridium] symbiosum]
MKKNTYALIQVCTIGLFTALCLLASPVISNTLLILLLIRVIIFLRPAKGAAIQSFQNSGQALIVIDMQEAMCGRSGIYPEKEEFVEKVNQIILDARRQNQKIVYVCQEFHRLDSAFCFLAFGGRLLQGTTGASLCPDLEIADDAVFVKHEQDAFTSRRFAGYLNDNRINAVTVVGLDASACVYKTSLGAVNRGFHVTVIQDGIIGKNTAATKRALQKLAKAGVSIR